MKSQLKIKNLHNSINDKKTASQIYVDNICSDPTKTKTLHMLNSMMIFYVIFVLLTKTVCLLSAGF